MFCSSCGEKLKEGEEICEKCSSNNSSNLEPVNVEPLIETTTSTASSQKKSLSSFDFKSFLDFRTMITPSIIKFVYISSAILIALLTLFYLIFSIAEAGLAGFLLTILFGIIGQVLLRVYCELLILFFSIHKELKKSNQRNKLD